MNREEIRKTTKAAAWRCLGAKGHVSSVDLLMETGRLLKEDYERWRFKQIPYLERREDGIREKDYARADARLRVGPERMG